MSSKKVYFMLLAGVLLLFAAIAGSVYGADVLLQKQSDKLISLKTKDQALDQKQTALKKGKQDIAKYDELDQIAKAIVPQDKNQAEAVREIVKIAKESGISLASVTFPASSLGSASSGAAAAKPVPGAAVRLPSQLMAVDGIKGVYRLQITVQSDTNAPVPYNSFLSFLKRLENNRRTAQVNSIVLQPVPSNPNMLSFTLILDEYIKP